MKQFLSDLTPIMPFLMKIMYGALILICRKEIVSFLRDMLSEGTPLSSKRGIAFGAAWTLFYLCINHYQEVNPWVLCILLLLIILCMGFATFPEILNAWVQVRTFASDIMNKAGRRDAINDDPAKEAIQSPSIKVTTEVNANP